LQPSQAAVNICHRLRTTRALPGRRPRTGLGNESMLIFPKDSGHTLVRPLFSACTAPGIRRAAARFLLFVLLPSLAWSQQATPDTQVGDTVTHPVTGEDATVVEVLPGYGVLTDAGDVLLVYFTVGDSFTPPGATEPLAITAVAVNDDTGLVESITVDTDPEQTLQIAEPVDDQLAAWLAAQAAAQGAPGSPGGYTSIPAPPGNTNPYPGQSVTGDGGEYGADGVGTNIWIPSPFGDDWCTFVGVAPEAGEDGEAPDALTVNGDASDGDIEIVSNDWNAIHATSIGG